MKPRVSATDKAVLEIFLRYDVPEMGVLELPLVREQWRALRLRRRDLDDALLALIRRRWLLPLRADGIDYLKLTRRGFRHATVLPVRWSTLLHDAFVLRRHHHAVRAARPATY
ncbi:MAG TPA: hypothetical protein VHE37_04815 [Nevskiaceae bacterium]|nr:hypothetical protein [Nevskiaceae bacterium]